MAEVLTNISTKLENQELLKAQEILKKIDINNELQELTEVKKLVEKAGLDTINYEFLEYLNSSLFEINFRKKLIKKKKRD